MIALRVLGGVAVLVGLVLSVEPGFVTDFKPTDDLFERIERHVRWGLLVGIGLLFVVRTKRKPWGESIAHLVLWVVVGYLAMRFVGIALEGAGSEQQWILVAVEIAILPFPLSYLWWARRRADATTE